MGRRAQRQHWQAGTGAQNADVPGLGWGAAPGAVALRCPTAPSAAGRSAGKGCPRELGQGWISVALGALPPVLREEQLVATGRELETSKACQ